MTSPTTKSESSQSLRDTLDGLERTADQWYTNLDLVSLPSNLAVWGSLTGVVSIIERTFSAVGSQQGLRNQGVFINAARFAALLVQFVLLKSNSHPVRLSKFKWNSRLEKATFQALGAAHNYATFTMCFPAWHKDRATAEVVAPNTVRFAFSPSVGDRRVSAYQKGFRPSGVLGSASGEGQYSPPNTPQLKSLLGEVMERCRKTGRLSFSYDRVERLYEHLTAHYREALSRVFRRDESLKLNGYSLREFKDAYASLMAVCSVHEFVCFAWSQKVGAYPIESAVLLKPSQKWSEILAGLSALPVASLKEILSDLTLFPKKAVDLHVQPFVPLEQNGNFLSVVPHIVLRSNAEENILRICSYRRPQAYDAISLTKENQMRDEIIEACGRSHSVSGPIPLPSPYPDIDLIIDNSACSTLVIAELKWSRKPISPFERIDRDKELLKGWSQIRLIETFLRQNPTFLSEKGQSIRSLSEYRQIYYVVVARDHLIWIQPQEDGGLIEADTFIKALRKEKNLQEVMTELLKYEWLPTEGVDFFVRFDLASANGVTIQGETFYPVGS